MLQRAMDIDRHNVEALMTLGGMMAELNKWTEAEHLYREAITEKPDFADVYYHYGTYLHLKGKRRKVTTYFYIQMIEELSIYLFSSIKI